MQIGSSHSALRYEHQLVRNRMQEHEIKSVCWLKRHCAFIQVAAAGDIDHLVPADTLNERHEHGDVDPPRPVVVPQLDVDAVAHGPASKVAGH